MSNLLECIIDDVIVTGLYGKSYEWVALQVNSRFWHVIKVAVS